MNLPYTRKIDFGYCVVVKKNIHFNQNFWNYKSFNFKGLYLMYIHMLYNVVKGDLTTFGKNWKNKSVFLFVLDKTCMVQTFKTC